LKEKSSNLKETVRINPFQTCTGGLPKKKNKGKDENGDLLAGSQSILNTWKNYLCKLMNVRQISNDKHTEVLRLQLGHSTSNFF
jgi:hypothetical protein